jgi:hypothetical protein
MSEKIWFICISENVFGPVDFETIRLMKEQNRLQIHDFVWRAGLAKWTPMYQLAEFTGLAPAYPKTPIPKLEKPAAPAPPPAVAKVKEKAKKETPAPPAPPKVRATDRVAASGEVEIDGWGKFEIVNISPSGVLIACDLDLTVGAEIKLHVHLNGRSKPLPMTAIVIRQAQETKSKSAYAFEFVRLNPAHVRELKEFIESQQMDRAG